MGQSQARQRHARRKPNGLEIRRNAHEKTGYSDPISLYVEFLEANPKDAAMLKCFHEAKLRDIKTLMGSNKPLALNAQM